MPVVKIGTRGSALALAQAHEVKAALERLAATDSAIVVIKTSGDDASIDVMAPASGGGTTRPGSGTDVKGIFVKELEEALLDGRIDLAVHSAKDLPTDLPAGLILGAILARRDPHDAVATPIRGGQAGRPLADLAAGARVGASSLRRQAQVKRLRKDLEVLPIRGNVDTRLRKLDEGQYDAIILAACGLERLGLGARITQRLTSAQMLPAPGQGALAVEIRADRPELAAVCAALDDARTRFAVTAERALLRSLGGGCQVPIAALGTIDDLGNLTLEGAVFTPDGQRVIRQSLSGAQESAERLGITLASHLRANGADRLLFGQKAQAWQRPAAPSIS